MTDAEKLTDLTALYRAIIAKSTGRQVTQAGHKDKQTSFATLELSDMVKLYRQLWWADSGLPDLADLATPTTRRARPVRVIFGAGR